jgi:hypothetical protein
MWLTADVERAWRRRFAIALFANLLTHPLVWFFFPQLPLSHLLRLTLSELWAFGAEALFYWTVANPIRLARASMISLAANLTSFGFGSVVIQWLI